MSKENVTIDSVEPLSANSPEQSDNEPTVSGGITDIAGTDDRTDGQITITDRLARRRFFRQGSAFLLGSTAVGGALLQSGEALAADCDRGGSTEGKSAENAGNGSDSDTGAGADPIGCGRRYKEKPKISRRSVPLDRIKG